MNFSVTGEPIGLPGGGGLDQKRKQLMQSLLSGGPGQHRLLGINGKATGAGRGLSRGYTAGDSPNAAVPGLTFNPFLAQIQRGVGNLNAPTQAVRQSINDLTGGATTPGGPVPSAPQPGGPPVPDPGPGGIPGANPGDLAAAMAAAGVANFQGTGDNYGWLTFDPNEPQGPPPPQQQSYQGIQFLRGRGGVN